MFLDCLCLVLSLWVQFRAAIVLPNLGGCPPKSVWEEILGGWEEIWEDILGGFFYDYNYAMVLNVKYLHRYVPVYLALFI